MGNLKKCILCSLAALVLLAVITVSASAEPVFAFEYLEYSVNVKKNIELKPILQGATLSSKAKYTWESDNPEICTVTEKGKVTGVSAGQATVRVSVTDEDGTSYTTSAVINVIQPVTKISFAKETVKVAAGYTLQLEPVVQPEDATNPTLRYVSSDPDICTVSDKGVITGRVKRKNCTITVEATDGSGVKAKVKVKVVNFILPTDKIVISERKTYYLVLEPMNYDDYCLKYKRDGIFQLGNLIEDMNNWYDIGVMKIDDPETGKNVLKNVLLIEPVKAGKQQLKIFDVDGTWGNGQSETIEIIIEPSATYSDKSFPALQYAKVIEDPQSFVGNTVCVTGTVMAVDIQGNPVKTDSCRYTIATKGEHDDLVYADIPMTYLKNKTCRYNVGEKVKIYGVWKEPETFSTETGLTQTRPVILIEKINDYVLNTDLELLCLR